MKILLRNNSGMPYVWKTAKYNKGRFVVNNGSVDESNIVSIVNDNRKNYIYCSCCGEVFRRGDKRFEQHKANAIKPETCFGCKDCQVEDRFYETRTFTIDKNGNFIEKSESSVDLVCGLTGGWWSKSKSITSDDAISQCKKRQCADAIAMEISDFFTQYPGAFDDILTIDSVLDIGCDDVRIPNGNPQSWDIEYTDDYTIGVYINNLGIIDRFYVWYDGDKHWIFYSKKYDELFYQNGCDKYEIWDHPCLSDELRNEIKTYIAKLYR